MRDYNGERGCIPFNSMIRRLLGLRPSCRSRQDFQAINQYTNDVLTGRASFFDPIKLR